MGGHLMQDCPIGQLGREMLCFFGGWVLQLVSIQLCLFHWAERESKGATATPPEPLMFNVFNKHTRNPQILFSSSLFVFFLLSTIMMCFFSGPIRAVLPRGAVLFADTPSVRCDCCSKTHWPPRPLVQAHMEHLVSKNAQQCLFFFVCGLCLSSCPRALLHAVCSAATILHFAMPLRLKPPE